MCRVWNIHTWEEPYTAELPHSSAYEARSIASQTGLALSADGGRLATTHPALGVVELATGTQVEINSQIGDTRIDFSPDGQRLAVSDHNGNVSLVDCTTGQALHSMRAPHPVGPFAFSPDGRTLAGGMDIGLVMLWHVATGQELASFSIEPGPVGALRFSDDGCALAAAVVKDSQAALYLWSSQ